MSETARTELRSGTVHLWSTPLDHSDADIRALRPVLSPGELERADRFVFDRDRRWYVASHVFLRQTLARYTGHLPEELEFTHGDYGKPALSPNSRHKVEFNMSHCRNLAVVAVAREEVGVDVEWIREMKDCDAIAKRFFSEREYQALRALAGEDKSPAFFRCWTRKEAVIKAVGLGLSMRLDAFDVTFLPDVPPEITRAPDQDTSWSLLHFEPMPGAVGAIASRSRIELVAPPA